jgi:hypothetical protein
MGFAGEVKELKLDKTEKGFYRVNAEIHVQAEKEKIIALLTDYNYLTRLNSQVLESELIKESSKSISLVRTKIHLCGYLFCKTINQVQGMQKLSSGSITAVIIPEQSDFIEGNAKWDVQSQDGFVIIKFQASFLPRFWVPPLINLWVMQRMFENELAETIHNLENLQLR